MQSVSTVLGPDISRPEMSAFVLVLQDKVTKEMNFILANQETIQSQICQLEDAIKQMEVNYLSSVSYLIFCHTLSLNGYDSICKRLCCFILQVSTEHMTLDTLTPIKKTHCGLEETVFFIGLLYNMNPSPVYPANSL